jgi:ribosome biogenesis GTPase
VAGHAHAHLTRRGLSRYAVFPARGLRAQRRATLLGAGVTRIVKAASPAEIEAARGLFQEYAAWTDPDLGFQGLDAESESLPGEYAPPRGVLLLALEGPTIVGCVGLRPLDWPATAGLERLYVRPEGRGRQVGRLLTEAALTSARDIGYRRVRLETLPTMAAAQHLYESLGFREIDACRLDRAPGVRCLELELHAGSDRDQAVSDSDGRALEELGCSPRWTALFEPYEAAGLTLARVIRSDRGSALVSTPTGVVRVTSSTDLLKAAGGAAHLPAVGDWVAVLAPDDLDVPIVEAVLERASAITRGDPGETSEAQVLAANIDTVFIVHPIAEQPNLRRIERELSVAWDSGAVPVVVLTKVDLSADVEAARSAVESVAQGVDVLTMNALTGEGVESLLAYISGHRTAVLIGPSGVGKSTIINALLGEQRQATCEVRVSDGRGRHTTVARELVQMPGGGLLIDTPGLRALGLTGSEDGISSTFPDIEEASEACHFRDCTHSGEPGCAVSAALEAGDLPPERLASYHKLMREAQVAAIKTDVRLRAEEERKRKTISKAAKEYFKRTGRG